MMKHKFQIVLLCFVLITIHHAASSCMNGFFECGDGRCIADFFKCDGDNDCGDFKDELNCSQDSSKLFNSHTCPSDHFACNDQFNTCIPQRWVCDGMSECSNGLDESNCTAANVDCGSDFKCANLQCVPSMWRCDQVFDCEDNSDELNCTSFQKKLQCDKEHGMFQCSSGLCIPYSKVCDNHNDCLFGEDEGSVCHAKACFDKKCSHLCLLDTKTNSSICYCPPGFKLFNNTCIDFDECQDNKLTNLCTQRCINLEGSYKCDCFEDYRMVGNVSCEAIGESPTLFVSTDKEIRAYDVRQKSLFPVVESSNSEMIIAMDVLVKEKKLFYSGYTNGSQNCIYQVSFDGSNDIKTDAKPLYNEPLSQIEGIAIDWLAGHFYFTESNMNKIIVCNIHSLICTTLFNNLNSPRGIIVVPTKAKLYWTEWSGNSSGIYDSMMDGSDKLWFIKDTKWPNNLAYDEVADRIYWCNGYFGLIEYYDFETKIRHIVFEDKMRQPYSLFVFEDTLYWSDWSYQEVIGCNKITCHNISHPLLQYHSKTSRGFFSTVVYHPFLQKAHVKTYNPCEINSCSHLCLIKSPSSYSCACPDHTVLASDGRTCRQKSDQSYVLVSTGYKIFKFYMDTLSNYYEEVNILPNYHISQFAFNYDREEAYIHDNYKNRIGVLDLKREIHQQWRSLVDYDLDAVMSMVYDVNTDNIYWVDMIKQTLEVCTTTNAKRAILNKKLIKPISLAIHAQSRIIYVGLRTTPAQIISLDMEGKHVKTILTSETGLPLSIATYYNELVWADPILQKIDFVAVNRQKAVSQPQKLIESHVDTVNSIAVLNDTLFWTNTDTSALHYSFLNHSIGKKSFKKELTDSHVDNEVIKVVAATKQEPLYQFCLPGNHKCAHVCLIGSHGSVCKCSIGFTSTDNGLTCTKTTIVEKFPVIHLDINRFFDYIFSNQKDSNLDTWSHNELPETSKDSKNKPDVTSSVSTDSSVPPSSKALETQLHNEVSEETSFGVWFWPVFSIILIVITLLVVYKMRQSSFTLMNEFGLRMNSSRGETASKQVRFFTNPNYNPGFMTDTLKSQDERIDNQVVVNE